MPCCRTYVCFPCQSAQRGGHLTGPSKCSFCHGAMIEISAKFEVPRKGDKRGWRELEGAVKGHWLAGHNLISKRHQRRR
jgi:hypothetical protein